MCKRIITILGLLTFFVPLGFAFFDKDMRVLTIQEGLGDNMVHCIHKDSDGFMWFGTYNGLSRYDGKYIRNFSIPGEYLSVYQIRETENCLLWLFTSKNILCFDRRTERLITVETSKWWRDMVSSDTSTMLCYSEKLLSRLQINYFYTKNGELEKIKLEPIFEEDGLCDDASTIQTISLSHENQLFVITSCGYVIEYELSSRKETKRKRLLNMENVEVTASLFSNGCLYFSTIAEGMMAYDPRTGNNRQYKFQLKPTSSSLSHHDVHQIISLSNGRLLAATWNGYTVLEPENDNPVDFTTQIYNHTTSHVLRNEESRMISAYYDPAGMLWIGTRGGGVYLSDVRLQFFDRYHQDTHNEICGILADDEDHLWIAGFHHGVRKSQNAFNFREKLAFEPVALQAGNTVLTMVADKAGNFWFGGRGGVLVSYLKDNQTYRSYPICPKDAVNWEGEVWSIFVGKDGMIWLGTNNGLLCFDKETGDFTLYQEYYGIIRAVVEGPDNYIWLGTTNGLMKFSLTDRKVIDKGYEERKRIEAREIRSLLAASSGDQLYIGYSFGLGVKAQTSEGIDYFYTTREGLSSNFIGCIVEDSVGDIWLGTNSSITRFNNSQQLFYNYYISSSNRSAYLLGNYLFWGNNLNLTYFDPEQVKQLYGATGQVKITQLEVDNKLVEIGDKINKQEVLKKSTVYTRHLTLNQHNNSFSLSFSNLTFSQELQKYGYRLQPYQSEWVIVNEGGKAIYANLPKGDYTFEVKSIFLDGTHSEITTIGIKILPIWYETLVARIVYFVLLFLVLVWMISWIKRRQDRLAKVERLKHELAIANLERDKEKQIYHERENFFINVSHELRTPLTLIISPLQELLQTDQVKNPIRGKLDMMYRNATSLSSLMDQLLYIQKIESGMVELHPEKTEIVDLVRRVFLSFGPLAGVKNIDYKLECDVDFIYLWVDMPKVESAIRNLLSNAFKYTPDGQKIKVHLCHEVIDDRSFCLLSVIDTGEGIAQELQGKIFDSFITGSQVPSFSTKIGIGLRIVKHTMDIHHGRVVLHSKPGEGATFTLYFPIGNEYYAEDNFNVIKKHEKDADIISTNLLDETQKNLRKDLKNELLIIEDNDEMRSYICTLFNDEYRVLEAKNGEEGLKSALEHIPDLILSDIMMPVMDGFEVSRRLKEHVQTAHIPVVMLTAKSEDTDILKSMRFGVDDYIMKPFNPEVLKEKVKCLIKNRELLKRIYTKTLLMTQHSGEILLEEEERSKFMQQLIQIVEQNLTNPDFNVKVLAEFLNVSQPTLYRKTKRLTGLSIIEIIRSIRISKSAALIMQKKNSIQEVAEKVGYNDLNTFRKHFMNQFGMPPSKFNEEQSYSSIL